MMTHRVKAGRARVEIAGSRVFAAPIHQIASDAMGRTQPISGVVEADLAPNGRYVVNGVVDGYRREIWLEDEATRAIIGEKIVYRPPPPPEGTIVLHTCCNLHYRDRSIVLGQWASKQLIPAGTPIVVKSIGRRSTDVDIDGRGMTLRYQIQSAELTPEQLIDRIAVKADPRPAIDKYPDDVREAIRHSKVVKGMTREQVLVAIGHPTPRDTPSLDSRRWIYDPFADFLGQKLELVFDQLGVLTAIEGAPGARAFAEYTK